MNPEPPRSRFRPSAAASQRLLLGPHALAQKAIERGPSSQRQSVSTASDALSRTEQATLVATRRDAKARRRRFKSQAEARMVVFEWIVGWYNPHRRHSSLG